MDGTEAAPCVVVFEFDAFAKVSHEFPARSRVGIAVTTCVGGHCFVLVEPS